MNKQEVIKAWNKLELNSSYKPLRKNVFEIYNEEMSHKITKEGKKQIVLVNKLIKNNQL